MSPVTIFDIKRFAVHDGPGIRTTVFMKGCPLDCWWCHNPESRSKKPQEVSFVRKLGDKEVNAKKVYGRTTTVNAIFEEILKDKIFFEESGGGVTFSGGEPFYQPKALHQLLKYSSELGLHTAVDTCGFAQWKVIEKVLPYTNLFLFDLKLMDVDNHLRYTGVSNKLILENLERLVRAGAMVEIRIPMIPEVNDHPEETKRFIDILEKKTGSITQVRLLPYHEIADNKYQKLNMENRMKGMNTRQSGIDHFKDQLEEIGLNVGIGG